MSEELGGGKMGLQPDVVQGVRKVLWVAAGFAFLYSGWTFAKRLLPPDNAPAARKATAVLPPGLDDPPGSPVRIRYFYPNTHSLPEGDSATICYSTANATTVTLEPAVEELKPALNRCFAVSPLQATVYRLTAEGEGGSKATAEFRLPVHPKEPEFLFADTSGPKLKRGDFYAVCFGVRHADRVMIEPIHMPVPASPKRCVQFKLGASTKLQLVAVGRGGTAKTPLIPVTVE